MRRSVGPLLKTLLPTRHEASAVVDYLRSRRPVYLARLDADTDLLAP